MDTKEQLAQASEELREGMKAALDGLKGYGKAVINHTGAVMGDAKDRVTDYATTQAANYYLSQAEKEQSRLEQETIRAEEKEREEAIKANTREHKIGMKEALKEQAREEKAARRLAFKENVKQKVSSAKGKLGSIKKWALEKLNPNNLDVKFRDLVERVEIRTLELAQKGKEVAIDTRDKVVDSASTIAANYYLNQAEKEQARLEQEEIETAQREYEAAIKANTREHIIGMREALREHERQEKKARRLDFRNAVKEKISSVKGKLGSVKNAALAKLNPSNLDVKFRDLVERVEIGTLELAQKGKDFTIETKDRVVDSASTIAANYYLNQAEKEQARLEQEAIRAKEREREEAIKANTREHKIGMKEALKEQAREEKAARRLAFKENVKQKVSSAKGKLGSIKKWALEKLNPNNLDVKFRDLVERVEIRTLELAQKGKEVAIDTRDKVVDYASTVAANYYLRQEEKQTKKEFKRAQKEAEMAEIEKTKARVRERKEAMKVALNASEREMYEQRHLDNEAKKAELMSSLFGEHEEQQEIIAARAI